MGGIIVLHPSLTTLYHVHIAISRLTDGNQKTNLCMICKVLMGNSSSSPSHREEHRRRSPHCPFVDVADKRVNPKKKSRSSKASRISTQSNITIASEIPSQTELTSQDGNTVLTTATDLSMAPTGVKKVAKGKKVTTKSKGRKVKARPEDAVEVNNIDEPENDNFEVKIEKPTRATRGRKRKSSELETTESIDQQEHIEEEIPAPAPKRRTAKTRSSVAQQANVTEISAVSADVDAENNTINPFSIPIVTKKTRKTGGRKASTSSRRGSKRKISSASTASKASLRSQVPDDDELERALEIDLDRPLTDEEDQGRQDDQVEEEKPKGNRRTRKPSTTRKASASIAPVRKVSKANALKLSDELDQQMSQPTVMVSGDPPSVSYPNLQNMLGSKETRTSQRSLTQSVHAQKAADNSVPLPTQPKTTPSPSPQSSDAENHPPSSKPPISSAPRSSQPTRRVFLTTPTIISPSKRNMIIHGSDIRNTGMAWTAIDLETIFLKSSMDQQEDKENPRDKDLLDDVIQGAKGQLTSPEKKMTVEEWVHFNARLSEERLRRECERRISVFEREGNRALQVLEGLAVAE